MDRCILQAAGLEDLHRPVEVRVGDFGVQDLLVRGRIEPPAAGLSSLKMRTLSASVCPVVS